MAEAKVGFLFKAAAAISKGQNDHVHDILKSYYLLRCKETTKGYGLPQQQFSNKSRCTRCFIEWNNYFESRVKPLRLSKKQKQRIKGRKKKRRNKEEIIDGNIFEQTCSFCKHTTRTYIAKPDKKIEITIDKNENFNNTGKHEEYNKNKGLKTKQNHITDVYCKSLEVFSLKSNKNTLQSAIKKPEKIIKNNKRKKDKFAGLCQRAVLSAAKIKDKTDGQNLIKMFLKPSS